MAQRRSHREPFAACAGSVGVGGAEVGGLNCPFFSGISDALDIGIVVPIDLCNFFYKTIIMSCKKIPYPKNAPGDFYVEDGCCISCNIPFTEAPTLFESADDGHCYVSKQPSNNAELYAMIQAFVVQDVGCIRYKGTNRIIQIRLIANGEGDQCDNLPPDLSAINQEIQADKCMGFKS
jgi:hypothetical protein